MMFDPMCRPVICTSITNEAYGINPYCYFKEG
jgi:hypothetical protein